MSDAEEHPLESLSEEEPADDPSASTESAESADDDMTRAAAYLDGLFERLSMDPDVDIQVDGRFLRINVSGEGAEELIPGKGATARTDLLDAIQLLLARSIYGGDGGRTVVVDADGYRDRRLESLVAPADRLAELATTRGRAVAVFGMNSFDRRAVHLRLAERSDVETDSSGHGVLRQLTISPTSRSGGEEDS
jgi:spoIIIJ-associated protein